MTNTEALTTDTEALIAMASQFGLASFARHNGGSYRMNIAQANALAASIRSAMAALAEARAALAEVQTKNAEKVER